jgi:hypothetical protein
MMPLVSIAKEGGLMIAVQPSPFFDRLDRFLAVGLGILFLVCVITPEIRWERDNAVVIRFTRDIDQVNVLNQQIQRLVADQQSRPQNAATDNQQIAQLNAAAQPSVNDLPEAIAAWKVVSAEVQLWTTICLFVGGIAFMGSACGFVWWYKNDRCRLHGEQQPGTLKAAAA